MAGVQWTLYLFDRSRLYPARSSRGRRWQPNARVQTYQAQRCQAHQDCSTHQPMPTSTPLPTQPSQPAVLEEIFRVITLVIYWRLQSTSTSTAAPIEQKKWGFFDTSKFQQIRAWEPICNRTLRTSMCPPERHSLRACCEMPGLCAIPCPKQGVGRSRSRHRSTRRSPRRHRHYWRDRLNSSDDVIGQECVSTSDTASGDDLPHDSQRGMENQSGAQSSTVRPDAHGPPRASRAPCPYDESDSEEPYDHTLSHHRQAALAESIAYRQTRDQLDARQVALGSAWTRVGSRWRLTLPVRGMEPPHNLLRLSFQPHQLPASPAAVERT